LPDALELLRQRAQDENPRVRLEAVVAASYLPAAESVEIVTAAWAAERDPFLDYAIRQSAYALKPQWEAALAAHQLRFGGSSAQAEFLRKLAGTPHIPMSRGQSVYETVCVPCHQPEGKGLPGVYPPLTGSEWVVGDKTTPIKILLYGLTGPIEVAGQRFGGPASIAMPSLGSLSDEQIADVLNFIRKEFSVNGTSVSSEDVRQVRQSNANRPKPWTAAELRK
jgi:mono/diheme cytochrome c family protein